MVRAWRDWQREGESWAIEDLIAEITKDLVGEFIVEEDQEEEEQDGQIMERFFKSGGRKKKKRLTRGKRMGHGPCPKSLARPIRVQAGPDS